MDSSREFSCPVDSSSPAAAQRHPESKVHVQSNSAWFLFVNHEEKYYVVVQPSDLQSGFESFTSTCKAPPCPCHVPGQQPQHQRGSQRVSNKLTNPVYLGHLFKAACGHQPLQPPDESPHIAAPCSVCRECHLEETGYIYKTF